MNERRRIATETMATSLRPRIIRLPSKEILISRLSGSGQEVDMTKPPNCGGLGRIRHFRRTTEAGWPSNPLPIDPAQKALGSPSTDILEAQVFQNAACAWRCWYCYVPFDLLAGNPKRGEWTTCERLVELYLAEMNRPLVIDLSGGSPDLTPEWVVWMMDALERNGLAETTYLWSDDNLSTDYIFTKLSSDDKLRLTKYHNYGRVCCFKGFDPASFSFNTGAESEGYDAQFHLFSRYLDLGIDLYAYATFTGDKTSLVAPSIKQFVDRLQSVAENLPLRLIPLRVEPASPMLQRNSPQFCALADGVQNEAIAVWNQEIEQRFAPELRAISIADVPLKSARH